MIENRETYTQEDILEILNQMTTMVFSGYYLTISNKRDAPHITKQKRPIMVYTTKMNKKDGGFLLECNVVDSSIDSISTITNNSYKIPFRTDKKIITHREIIRFWNTYTTENIPKIVKNGYKFMGVDLNEINENKIDNIILMAGDKEIKTIIKIKNYIKGGMFKNKIKEIDNLINKKNIKNITRYLYYINMIDDGSNKENIKKYNKIMDNIDQSYIMKNYSIDKTLDTVIKINLIFNIFGSIGLLSNAHMNTPEETEDEKLLNNLILIQEMIYNSIIFTYLITNTYDMKYYERNINFCGYE